MAVQSPSELWRNRAVKERKRERERERERERIIIR